MDAEQQSSACESTLNSVTGFFPPETDLTHAGSSTASLSSSINPRDPSGPKHFLFQGTEPCTRRTTYELIDPRRPAALRSAVCNVTSQWLYRMKGSMEERRVG
ncbi:hypothetical protein EYF80_019372 [Liparis tanakae]|uniref:Uncharacterized protein n=1 Tax=Liparis tanakae TaxID=230148 RepID=A0A4Z2HWW4_9TELE|nr:hypothetical protein EYF80_019372 [Liparis tanakae]